MSASTIYLITRIDTIFIFSAITLIMSIIIVVGILASLCQDVFREEEKPIAIKWFKRSIVACIISLIILVFVPDRSTLTAMGIIPKITNNEQGIQSE